MYSNILFDLDGTLTDPKLGIMKSVQYSLEKFGIMESNLDKLEPFIGPPLGKSFNEIFAFSESESKRAIEFYREYFKDRGIFENKLYEGIPELLEMLRNQRKTLIVATSKPTVFAQKILDYFDIACYFDYICGSHLDGTRSDKGEIIRYVLDEKSLKISETVMIGDREHDIIGAQKNGIDSIGVLYGYGGDEEIINIHPTYIIKTVGKLYEVL